MLTVPVASMMFARKALHSSLGVNPRVVRTERGTLHDARTEAVLPLCSVLMDGAWVDAVLR
jgi:hypothetical protein